MSARPLAPLVTLALAGALALAVASPAAAQCGAPVRSLTSPGPPRPPLVLGDSTMIFAVPGLGARGLEADAEGCRNFAQGVEIVRERARAGTLPRIVVMALGANWTVSPADLRAAAALVGPDGRLVLVTTREAEGASSSDAVAQRAEARRRPDRVVLLDWARVSRGHTSWFAPDGLHLSYAGAAAFVDFVLAGLRRVPARRDFGTSLVALDVAVDGVDRLGEAA